MFKKEKEQTIKNYNAIEEFKNYVDKIGNRKNIYKIVKDTFDLKSAIYPGSYIDIVPSLILEEVIYIDNFKKANTFFKQKNEIVKYIEENKEYSNPSYINFIYDDYSKVSNIEMVDLIISQYAGFVGQEIKQFLKIGGILLANDSHGDATLAYLDESYQFIATLDNDIINFDNLEKYFFLSRKRMINLSEVNEKQKGPKYINNAQNYIFKKIK